jgi:hypothetical protein
MKASNSKRIFFPGLKNGLISFVGPTTIVIYTMFMIFFLPFNVGILDYSYWQYYLLLVGLVGFFQLGFNDGFYLDNLTENYDSKMSILHLSKIFSVQFIIQLSFCIILIIISMVLVYSDLFTLFIFSSLNIVIFNSKSVLIYYLNSKNRFTASNFFISIEKFLFVILLVSLILFSSNINYQLIIAIDVFIKFVVLILLIKFINLKFIMRITSIEIRSYFYYLKKGFFLMIVNFSSSLVIALTRFFIESTFGILSFGSFSLGLSLINVSFLFFNSLSFVITPYFFRGFNIKKFYFLLTIILFSFIYFSFPLYIVVDFIFRNFANSSKYFYILFPLIVLEGKYLLYQLPLIKKKKLQFFNFLVNLVLIFFLLLFSILIKLLRYSIDSYVLLFVLVYLIKNLILDYRFKNYVKLYLLDSSVLIIIVFLNFFFFELSYFYNFIATSCLLVIKVIDYYIND